MHLSALELSSFRNYGELKLAFFPGTHVFYGANAQGKTNLLEAIFLCTCARSHRTGRDEDLIKKNSDYYRSTIYFETDKGLKESVSFAYYDAGAKGSKAVRKMYYNNIEVDRISEMIGLFHAVIFAPEDLQIVKGSPAHRRRFLDLIISQTNRNYFRSLQEFNRILMQRNTILKKMRNHNVKVLPRENESTNSEIKPNEENQEKREVKISDELLSFSPTEELLLWDKSIVKPAVNIILARMKYVERINELASLALHHLTDFSENLEIKYKGVNPLSPAMSVAEMEDYLLNKLKRNWEDDIHRGSTSFGPHRDDLDIQMNNLDLRCFGSQGQQRSVVLALKIAELLLLQELTGEKPILLLDDVMSELDQKRRNHLLEIISDHQVFMTDTSKEQIFSDPENKQHCVHFYRVEAGTVTAEDSIISD